MAQSVDPTQPNWINLDSDLHPSLPWLLFWAYEILHYEVPYRHEAFETSMVRTSLRPLPPARLENLSHILVWAAVGD